MRIAVSRSSNAERVVTPLELFFDLVYVFAIGQLSHHLLEHIDLRTGAETVILALAVFYAWYMTAWGANWLEPDRLPVQLLLVGLTFVSLLMSVAIAEANGQQWPPAISRSGSTTVEARTGVKGSRVQISPARPNETTPSDLVGPPFNRHSYRPR